MPILTADVECLSENRGRGENKIASRVLPCHIPVLGVQRGHGMEVASEVNQVISHRKPSVIFGVVSSCPDHIAGCRVERVDVVTVRTPVTVVISCVDDITE